MHDQIHVGALVPVSGPANELALDEAAAHSVLVAVGIGIKPLWCMAHASRGAGRLLGVAPQRPTPSWLPRQRERISTAAAPIR